MFFVLTSETNLKIILKYFITINKQKMDNTVVYPPNKSFDRIVNFSNIPVMYRNFLFMDFNENGESILSCSNFGTLWESTLFYFMNDRLLSLNYSKTYISSTTSDAKFIDNDTIALAENTGTLNILSTTINENYLESINYFRHIDPITQVAVWGCNTNVLTSSGNTITIWDVKNDKREPLKQFVNIHTETINSVDTIKSDPFTFLSASTDKKCCIWDYRASKAAMALYVNEFCSLTSVASNEYDSNYLLVGTEAGDIYLLDKREPKDFICTFSVENNIYKISNDMNKFAICNDSNQIHVLKQENGTLSKLYSNKDHENIVRGLAWYKDNLYSCAFDKKVIKHLI